MYVLEYCKNPDNIVLHHTNITYGNDFGSIYDNRTDALDRFIFLVDMYQIIKSCSEDLKNAKVQNRDDWWKVNKTLLNYVNAVFSYKEYINSYDPPLREVTERYYKQQDGNQWYRFICDYRDRVIHQSTIIKDYQRKTDDILVDIDDVIKIVDDADYIKIQHRKAADLFIKKMNDMRRQSIHVKGRDYFSMKEVVMYVDEEIDAMTEKALSVAFDNGVRPIMEWLISLCHIVDGHYMYTFIVDKELYDEYEPNYTLEDFSAYIIRRLGQKHIVVQQMTRLLEKNGYTYFYDGKCGIEEFLKHASRNQMD